MNDRIKELAIKAGFNEMGIWNIVGIEEYHAKFAELIVKECIDYCGENLSKTVGAALKIHFGVEIMSIQEIQEIFKNQPYQNLNYMYWYGIELMNETGIAIEIRNHKFALDTFPDNLEYIRMLNDTIPLFKESNK